MLRNFFIGVLTVLFSLFGITEAHAAIVRQLELGSVGPDIVELQSYLALDTSLYPPGRSTGIFDFLTQLAVQRFQSAQGIVSGGTPATTGYGRVGPRTIVRLNTILPSYHRVSAVTTSTLSATNTVTTLLHASVGLPLRLRIPKIAVDASITYVGLTPQGAMGAPKGPTDAAWFDLGPRPGEQGSAVIAGHFGPWKNGQGSVFDRLNRMEKGDELYVDDGAGTVITFVVRKVRTYEKSEDAVDVFGSSDGMAHLNLITCEGVWSAAQKTYSNRLVVFADKKR